MIKLGIDIIEPQYMRENLNEYLKCFTRDDFEFKYYQEYYLLLRVCRRDLVLSFI